MRVSRGKKQGWRKTCLPCGQPISTVLQSCWNCRDSSQRTAGRGAREAGASKPLSAYCLSEMNTLRPVATATWTPHSPGTTTEGLSARLSFHRLAGRVCGQWAPSLGCPGQPLAASPEPVPGHERPNPAPAPAAVGSAPLPVVWKPLPTAGLLGKGTAI